MWWRERERGNGWCRGIVRGWWRLGLLEGGMVKGVYGACEEDIWRIPTHNFLVITDAWTVGVSIFWFFYFIRTKVFIAIFGIMEFSESAKHPHLMHLRVLEYCELMGVREPHCLSVSALQDTRKQQFYIWRSTEGKTRELRKRMKLIHIHKERNRLAIMLYYHFNRFTVECQR